MMATEKECMEEMEEVLDQYFPKGDPRRGDALMLFATGMSRICKLIRALPIIRA